MKLTDNEKRDVVKLIEEGKTLPEKYRFLLFDEVKQVELIWNKKSNEITNIVLPFQIIEQVDEPRS
ncbi:MAG: site-specific DNA-methyltransferase, partial [Pseudomonadota bacterium]|nr:site-specific DNA-methyltransferase [Pseudomonadota bacterium]